MAYETNNPYNGDRVQQFAEHTDSEVEIALARAHSCLPRGGRRHLPGEPLFCQRPLKSYARARRSLRVLPWRWVT
jgi:hypothetical protein